MPYDPSINPERRRTPQPLTEDQLAHFTTQSERAVTKAVRKVLASAVVGYAILFAGVFGMYENGQHVSAEEREAVVQSGAAVVVDSCNRDYNATVRLRGLFQRLTQAVKDGVKEGRMSAGEAEFALKFYRGELEKIPLPDCRKVAEAITDDPDNVTRMPKPLHPPNLLRERTPSG